MLTRDLTVSINSNDHQAYTVGKSIAPVASLRRKTEVKIWLDHHSHKKRKDSLETRSS